MGIRSTRTVSREYAINRIKTIDRLLRSHECSELNRRCFEPEENVVVAVRGYIADVNEGIVDLMHLDKWTDEMLGDFLDRPWFRQSMFDNHLVSNDTSAESEDY